MALGIFMKIYDGKRTSKNYQRRSLPGQEQLKELEILFQRLLFIVYTTLSFNLCSIIVILSGVIVEKLCLTGYRNFRTVLLVFSPFLDTMLMPTAYLDNYIGKT